MPLTALQHTKSPTTPSTLQKRITLGNAAAAQLIGNKMQQARTIGQLAIINKGHTTGFDYLRIGLSVAVVLSHCVLLGAGKLDLLKTSWHALFAVVLPAFFALSGYLVTSSAYRNTVPQFIALRVLRIFPALVIEVLLSAFALGIAFTVLPLGQYFTHPMFWLYLLNMIGYIHYSLPGVFDGDVINLQLWTIPLELECYIIMVVLMLVPTLNRRHLTLTGATLGCLIMTVVVMRAGDANSVVQFSGRVLVFSFLFGNLIYRYRDYLRASLALFVISLVLSAIFLSVPALAYLSTAPVAYATVFIGLQRWRPIPFGDVSYGLYLFHFPVAQMINHLNGTPLPWYTLFGLTMILTLLFAGASWSFAEKPLMDRKPKVLAWLA